MNIQCTYEDAIDEVTCVVRQVVGVADLSLQHGLEGEVLGRASERGSAHQHLVQNTSVGPDVRGGSGGLVVEHLGRHVLGCAHERVATTCTQWIMG